MATVFNEHAAFSSYINVATISTVYEALMYIYIYISIVSVVVSVFYVNGTPDPQIMHSLLAASSIVLPLLV